MPRLARSTDAASQSLRLATLNMLRGGGARVRPAEVLRDTRADLLLLQEAAGFDGLNAPAVWRPLHRRVWGSAIVAAHGSLDAVAVPGFDGWVAAARWHRPNLPSITVVSVHAPHRRGGYARVMLEIIDAVGRCLDAGPGSELIVGGDFNICASRRSHRGGPPSAREIDVRMQLEKQFGLVSCWDAAHPRRLPAQTLRWTGNPRTTYHCDGLFIPAHWLPALRSCTVRDSAKWRLRSDHNPVIATFD